LAPRISVWQCIKTVLIDHNRVNKTTVSLPFLCKEGITIFRTSNPNP